MARHAVGQLGCVSWLTIAHPLPACLPPQGAFVGALVAMSSTSIVVKVLSDYRTQHSQPGQITIGTLVLQARQLWLLGWLPLPAGVGC